MKKTLLFLVAMIASLASWAQEESELICTLKATPTSGYEAYCGEAIFEEWSDKVVIKGFSGTEGDDLTITWDDSGWSAINGEACPWVYISNGGTYYGAYLYATENYTGGTWTAEAGGSFWIGAYLYDNDGASTWTYMYWDLTPMGGEEPEVVAPSLVVTPAEGTVESLSTITIAMSDGSMLQASAKDGFNIALYGEDRSTIATWDAETLSAIEPVFDEEYSPVGLTLTLPEELTTPGNYTLMVDASVFYVGEDMEESEAASFSWTIASPSAPLELVSAKLNADGGTLTFSGDIAFVDVDEINVDVADAEGEVVTQAVLAYDWDIYNIAVVTFNDPLEIGSYKMVIPADVIVNNDTQAPYAGGEIAFDVKPDYSGTWYLKNVDANLYANYGIGSWSTEANLAEEGAIINISAADEGYYIQYYEMSKWLGQNSWDNQCFVDGPETVYTIEEADGGLIIKTGDNYLTYAYDEEYSVNNIVWGDAPSLWALEAAVIEPDPEPVTISGVRVWKSMVIGGYLYENWSNLSYRSDRNYLDTEVDLIGDSKLVVKNWSGIQGDNLTITYDPETGKVSGIKEAVSDNWIYTNAFIDNYGGCYVYPSYSYVSASEDKGLVYISCYSFEGEAEGYPYIVIDWGGDFEITEAGFATASFASAVAIPADTKAYAVTGVEENGVSLVLTELVNSIPVNYGVLIEGAEGFYDIVAAGQPPRKVSGNKLVAIAAGEEVPVSGQYNNYVLQNQASHGVGFYLVENEGVTVSKASAYLQLEEPYDPEVKAFSLNDATTTAIKAITTGKSDIYDLQGRKLEKLQKGVNVVNGVKVLVK